MCSCIAEAKVGDHSAGRAATSDPATGCSAPGTTLGPAHVGVLAAWAAHEVSVYGGRRGSECCRRATSCGATEPARSRPAVSATPTDGCCCEALARRRRRLVDLGIAVVTRTSSSDVSRGTRSTRCDAVLTSGGVSVGEYDYVKAASTDSAHSSGVRSRSSPAKPLAFGVVQGVPAFGLPAIRCRRW